MLDGNLELEDADSVSPSVIMQALKKNYVMPLMATYSKFIFSS